MPKVGDTVRYDTSADSLAPQELNSNAPMIVTAVNEETGMCTLSRQNTVVGEAPAHKLVTVDVPVDNPPPVYPPDKLEEPPPSPPPVEPPPVEPPLEPVAPPDPNP